MCTGVSIYCMYVKFLGGVVEQKSRCDLLVYDRQIAGDKPREEPGWFVFGVPSPAWKSLI